jgi:hypothetical protein
MLKYLVQVAKYVKLERCSLRPKLVIWSVTVMEKLRIEHPRGFASIPLGEAWNLALVSGAEEPSGPRQNNVYKRDYKIVLRSGALELDLFKTTVYWDADTQKPEEISTYVVAKTIHDEILAALLSGEGQQYDVVVRASELSE